MSTDITWEDYIPALEHVKANPGRPFTENQLRHSWRNRDTNGITETGVVIMANGKLMIVLKRLPDWYEWQNKNRSAAA